MADGRTKIFLPLKSSYRMRGFLEVNKFRFRDEVIINKLSLSRKKRDPRKDIRMDFNRKHQIIQSL